MTGESELGQGIGSHDYRVRLQLCFNVDTGSCVKAKMFVDATV